MNHIKIHHYVIKLINPSKPGTHNNKGDVIFRGGH